MSLSITLIDLAGAVALLLWGTHMVQTGVQRAYGPGLRALLAGALRNRFVAFMAGLGVTALLQSSTATGLMVTGFAAGGMLALAPALAVMLGANVGTTVIVQILSFNVATVSPALILIGVLLFRRDTSARTHDLGRVFIGLGLMLLALHQLLLMMTPFEDTPSLRMFLGAIATVPIVAVLLGAAVTWAVHSSVAVVLFAMSLAASGALPPNAAFALVLGANLGTAVNPILEGPANGDPAARRVPVGNFLIRLVGVSICLATLDPIGRAMVHIDPDPARAIADFHTLFNVVLASLFFGVLSPYARLLEWLLPTRTPSADPSRPRYLDPATKETPVVALGAAAREALRLADVLEGMLRGARDAMAKNDRRLISETKRQDDVLDRLNTAIKTFLTSIDPEELGENDQRRLEQILGFAMKLEQAGDVIDRNLLPHAMKGLKRGLNFSLEDRAELLAMMDRLIINLRAAASLFMTDDSRAARLLAEEKVSFREAESVATAAHIDRLRTASLATAQASALHLDLLRDLKLANSYIVAAAAYPVLEQTGELLQSRITRLN
ncbi:Na/Pi cotransporter family protein [Tardiphaga sp.]|jgi:phosphate:Na+ symporter|uniref:Na/Pi cotransporter family protein n=1 Tax=Tardiphaga sp. TaxID=1926292 RepID=UPI0037DA0EB3